MQHSKRFMKGNETPTKEVGDGLDRQIFGYDDKILMAKIDFKKDAIGTLHQHPHSQVTYVNSGKFEVTIGSEKQILAAGDAFYAPPDTDHGVVCLEEGTLVDVFSPVREDFFN